MILADTSIWIEFLKRHEPFFDKMKSHLEEAEIVCVEWIFGELLQGARNQRERDIIHAYSLNLPDVGFPGVWVEAGRHSSEYHLVEKGVGLIDVAIVLAARKAQTKVWTLDKKLLSLLKKDETYEM